LKSFKSILSLELQVKGQVTSRWRQG